MEARSLTRWVWGRVGPGALGRLSAQIWGTRGERIPHERIHVVSVITYYRLTNLQTYKLTNLLLHLQTYKLTNFSL